MENTTINDCANVFLQLLREAKLSGQTVDEKFIDETISGMKGMFRQYSSFTAEDWKSVKFKIESNIDVAIADRAIVLANPSVERWLDHKRSEISWEYWEAYRQFLLKKGRHPDVIKETEKTIDEILDCSGDPEIEGRWNRRGLVMGNVQSGKTQNYLGLINKAIDSGYKVVIVLGGHLNELRTQTQERLDEGVIGFESKKRYEQGLPIGVGLYRRASLRASFLTTTEGDFKKNIANSIGIPFTTTESGPIIFVIKKWASVLSNLYDWICEKQHLDVESGQRLDYQLLLIDDEADYASINTKHERGDITSINSNIRKVLSLFNRSTYVGYTATPFANIFIDPDQKNDLIGNDLFPSDFMIRIPTPDNYVGYKYFFQDSAEIDPVVIVDDHEDFLPGRSNKEDPIGPLPKSLEEAIRCFLLSIAIREYRGAPKEHATMLVNMTYLTVLQNSIAEAIEEYMGEMRSASDYALGYAPQVAVEKSELVRQLQQTFSAHYGQKESFADIYPNLKRAIAKTKVFAVNAGSAEKLDYAPYKANGLSAIVVGGHKLSRGLTLQGLTVSYFTRNSKTYDTLMQMCRWFGYRPGYEDLCRVFITSESYEWYAFISNAIDELYSELNKMSDQKKTPSEFGLKVREHPGALLITSKQKMNAAHNYTRSLDLAGTRHRKHEYYVSDENNSTNISAVRKLVQKLLDLGVEQRKFGDGSIVFDGVEHSLVSQFISNTNYVEGDVTDDLLLKYIAKLDDLGLPKFSICIKNISFESKIWWSQNPIREGDPAMPSVFSIDPRLSAINAMKRKLVKSTRGNTIYREKQEIGDKHDESYFLTGKVEKKKEASSYYYIHNPRRSQPGLIIYSMAVAVLPKGAKKGDDTPLEVPHEEVTVAYSMSFPVHENLRNKSKKEIDQISRSAKISYVVNQIWRNTNLNTGMEYEDDE